MPSIGRPKPAFSFSLVLLMCLILPSAFAQQTNEKTKQFQMDGGNQYYSSWLDQDARWIITDGERAAFHTLKNDEERDHFIEAFWTRRNPTPSALKNAFEDEHYRRLVYANEHFAGTDVPGWQTDRGRIYIVYGPPDEIEPFPAGKVANPPLADNINTAFPKEIWFYRSIPEIGQNVKIGFVDTCMCDDFRMTVDPLMKAGLLRAPCGDRSYPNAAATAQDHTRILVNINVLESPPITKFQDLEEVVLHKFNYNLLPFEVATTFQKVTDATSLAHIAITVNEGNVKFMDNGTQLTGRLNMFGRIVNIGGQIVDDFEGDLEVKQPHEQLSDLANHSAALKNVIPLRPGFYRLEIAVKDVNGDKIGTWAQGIRVPD